MSNILREVRVRGIGQNSDIKVTIEKSGGLFSNKRKVYGIPWGKKEEAWSTWEPIEFTVKDLTEEKSFGEYQKYYEAYIKERDEPRSPYGNVDFHKRNNLEFSPEWNTDLDIIKLYILINIEKYKEAVYDFNLIEDPIKGEKGGPAPYYRNFGLDSYYLNNGVQIKIDWNGDVVGGERWSDDKGKEIDTPNPKFYFDKKEIDKSKVDKDVWGIILPEGVVDTNVEGIPIQFKSYYVSENKEGKTIYAFSPKRIENNSGYSKRGKYGGNISDIYILAEIISYWKMNVSGYEDLAVVNNIHGTPAIYLSDAADYKKIEYKSPFGTEIGPSASVAGPSASETIAAGPTASPLLKPTLEGIKDGFQITEKTDLPPFSIYTGDPKKDWPKAGAGELPENGEEFVNLEDAEVLDEEYGETEFVGDEEAPPDIPEVDLKFNSVADEGSTMVNNTSFVSTNNGNVVKLPIGNSAFSHNTSQGYNLIDSKWYGDLLTSALEHIDHPTFDIPGTEKGNLGCASWVSMVFYRAFGVNMRNGNPVKSVPKSVGEFGSLGTGELGGWFGSNPNMWQQIPWKQGQPGDIINTEKGSRAGHIGIVLNEKHSNGSWIVASNSSKGFGSKSDPAGCGKKNYNINTWQSVTDRNPTRTFCWRYKGPKLSQGQNA